MDDIFKDETVLLHVKGLRVYFPARKGLFRSLIGYVRAVDDVSFHVHRGETFGLVGESGCGKTTTGRSIMMLTRPTNGEVYYRRDKNGIVNLGELDPRSMKSLRRDMQMIFQDPYSSLNPRMTCGDIVAEPLRINKLGNRSAIRDRVKELLETVGIPARYLESYPNELSGGQRQRIGIARALGLSPKLIVCDEPVSALDVSIQAQILHLLENLQETFGLTYILISHDLSVIYYLCSRVAVMYLGKIVELGTNSALFRNPKHPYTEALMGAIPLPRAKAKSERILLPGDVPNSLKPPSGCYFHPRCKYEKPICEKEEPALRELYDKHYVACHRSEELELKAIVS